MRDGTMLRKAVVIKLCCKSLTTEWATEKARCPKFYGRITANLKGAGSYYVKNFCLKR